MSTAAIIALKQEEKAQSERLQQLIVDHKQTIEAGDRARRVVESQERVVADLTEAIITLEKQQASRTHEATV